MNRTTIRSTLAGNGSVLSPETSVWKPRPRQPGAVVYRTLLSTLLVIATHCLLIPPPVSADEPASPTIDLANPPADLNTTEMPVGVVEAYPNLRLSRPIVLTGAGDGSGRLFVAS